MITFALKKEQKVDKKVGAFCKYKNLKGKIEKKHRDYKSYQLSLDGTTYAIMFIIIIASRMIKMAIILSAA